MYFLKNNQKVWLAAALVIIATLSIYQFGVKSAVIEAYPVEKQDYVPSLIISGEIVPETSVALSAQTTGVVVQCLVQKGDKVQKGQALVQLDDKLAKLDLERAQQAVELAVLNLQQAGTVTLETAHLASVQADLEYEQSQKDYQRMLALWEAGAVSQQEMEVAANDLRLAQQSAHSAKVAWESFLDNGVNIGKLQNEVRQRQLDLTDKQVILEQFLITAPFEGQILELPVSTGELLQSGTKVALLSSNRYNRVRIKPDQRFAGMAVAGNRAEVWVSSQSQNKWEARVVFAEPIGDADQGTVTVELSLDNNIPELYPGQLVTVQLFGELSSQAIIIPDNYLTVQEGQSGVWLARSGRAHFKALEVGLQTPDGVLIQSGLQDGDILLYPDGLLEGKRILPRIEGKQ